MQNVFKFILNKLFGKSDLLQIAIIITTVYAGPAPEYFVP